MKARLASSKNSSLGASVASTKSLQKIRDRVDLSTKLVFNPSIPYKNEHVKLKKFYFTGLVKR